MRLLFKTILVAVLSMAASKTFAYTVEINGIYYECQYNHATVTYEDRYKPTAKYSGDIVIPETITYEGKVYKVEYIDNDAFAGCSNLNSVIIPQSVSCIFSNAFFDCTGLTYVYVPQNTRIFEDAFKGCPNLYQNPNKSTVRVTKTVIDTLKAEKKYEELKPTLLRNYHNGVAKQQRCNELRGMLGKKVKDIADLGMLSMAYEYYLDLFPSERYKDKVKFVGFANGIYGMGRKTVEVYDKNVKKGKITENVPKYLSSYNRFLLDSLRQEKEKIDKGWCEWLEKSELSYKKITVTLPNSFYRGRRYMYKDDLDSLEVYQQRKGWEFLDTKEREFKSESYPNEVSFLEYKVASDYRVTYSSYGIKEVYDKKGKLVYVPSLTRKKNEAELEDVRRLVYFKDYVNNKYDIKSQPEQTQQYIQLRLCRDNGFEETANEALGTAFATMLIGAAATELLSPIDAYKVRNEAKEHAITRMPTRDRMGENYIEQLEKDHADEFGYVYMIERLSNVSFRVVYLNKQTLEPSYCAVVTYRTGENPYTAVYSTKLIDMPADIPPVVK